MHIEEQRDDYIKLSSKLVTLVIAHNLHEKSNTLWLGRKGDSYDKVEVDNQTLKAVFKSNIEISNLPVEQFINNLFLFLNHEAQSFLSGDLKKTVELEEFDRKRSENYTGKLLVLL